MTVSALPPPRTPRQLLDDDFLENRGRVLELAAFLDRLDRAANGAATRDFRLLALQRALRSLATDPYPRVDAIHAILSDPGHGPVEPGRQAATGAFAPDSEEAP